MIHCKVHIYYKLDESDSYEYIDSVYEKDYTTIDYENKYLNLTLNDDYDIEDIISRIIDIDYIAGSYILESIYNKDFIESISYYYRELCIDRIIDDINSNRMQVKFSIELYDEFSEIRPIEMHKYQVENNIRLIDIGDCALNSKDNKGLVYHSYTYNYNTDTIMPNIAYYNNLSYGEDYILLKNNKNKDMIKSLKFGDIVRIKSKDEYYKGVVINNGINPDKDIYLNYKLDIIILDSEDIDIDTSNIISVECNDIECAKLALEKRNKFLEGE